MKNNKSQVIFLLFPAALLMVSLVFLPIIVTFWYSLRQMRLTHPNEDKFIGFENYLEILKDSDFWYSLQNSLIIIVVVVILAGVIGLLVSFLLNIETRIKGILAGIAIVPWALPPIVNGIIWRWIFHPSHGFLNKVLLRLNLIHEPILWLSSRFSIIAIIALVVAWRNIPFCAIVLLAALQSIPSHLYESARIDGANSRQLFSRITFPLLLPSLGIVLTMVSINAINVFDEIVSLSGYGNVSKVLMIKSYLTTFSFLEYGLGSALVYIITIITGLLGFFYVRNVYREVQYL